jgi:hypothetical protein
MATAAALPEGQQLGLQAGVQLGAGAGVGGGAGAAAPDPLNRYVELTPYAYHGAWEVVCKIMSIMVLVAFIAAAVAATIITGILMPIYLPIAAFMAYAFAPYAYNGYQYFQQLAAKQAEKGAVENHVIDLLGMESTPEGGGPKQLLIPRDPAELSQFLIDKLGVGRDISPLAEDADDKLSVEQVRHLAARHLYHVERYVSHGKAFNQLSQTGRDQLNTMPAQRTAVDPVQTLRTALIAREEMLAHKVYAAYFRGIILNPRLKEDVEIFELDMPPVDVRMRDYGILTQFGASPQLDLPFLHAKVSNHWLTRTEVQMEEVYDLTRRLLSTVAVPVPVRRPAAAEEAASGDSKRGESKSA